MQIKILLSLGNIKSCFKRFIVFSYKEEIASISHNQTCRLKSWKKLMYFHELTERPVVTQCVYDLKRSFVYQNPESESTCRPTIFGNELRHVPTDSYFPTKTINLVGNTCTVKSYSEYSV